MTGNIPGLAQQSRKSCHRPQANTPPAITPKSCIPISLRSASDVPKYRWMTSATRCSLVNLDQIRVGLCKSIWEPRKTIHKATGGCYPACRGEEGCFFQTKPRITALYVPKWLPIHVITSCFRHFMSSRRALVPELPRGSRALLGSPPV